MQWVKLFVQTGVSLRERSFSFNESLSSFPPDLIAWWVCHKLTRDSSSTGISWVKHEISWQWHWNAKKKQGGFISVKQNNNWMIECLPRSGQFYKIVLQIKSMEMQKSAICINSFISKNWGAIVANFKNPAPRASLSPIAYYCLNYLAGCIFQPELQLTFKLFSIGPPLQTCGIFCI